MYNKREPSSSRSEHPDCSDRHRSDRSHARSRGGAMISIVRDIAEDDRLRRERVLTIYSEQLAGSELFRTQECTAQAVGAYSR